MGGNESRIDLLIESMRRTEFCYYGSTSLAASAVGRIEINAKYVSLIKERRERGEGYPWLLKESVIRRHDDRDGRPRNV